MIIVEVAFESIASAEFLPTSADHHFPLPIVGLGAFRKGVPPSVLQGHTTADPLGWTLKTSVSPDVALEIRRPAVTLDPFAIGTRPGVAPRG